MSFYAELCPISRRMTCFIICILLTCLSPVSPAEALEEDAWRSGLALGYGQGLSPSFLHPSLAINLAHGLSDEHAFTFALGALCNSTHESQLSTTFGLESALDIARLVPRAGLGAVSFIELENGDSPSFGLGLSAHVAASYLLDRSWEMTASLTGQGLARIIEHKNTRREFSAFRLLLRAGVARTW